MATKVIFEGKLNFSYLVLCGLSARVMYLVFYKMKNTTKVSKSFLLNSEWNAINHKVNHLIPAI